MGMGSTAALGNGKGGEGSRRWEAEWEVGAGGERDHNVVISSFVAESSVVKGLTTL